MTTHSSRSTVGDLRKRDARYLCFAVTKAVGSTIDAVASDGKAGVVWHTQGSGKSMEMELYTNLVMRHPRLLNPTVVVITDRRELDGQLFRGFEASLLLPEKPRQITKRSELRDDAHWEARRQAMQPLIGAPGKGLIVGGTRVICAKLYQAIIELRPDWHADELERGLIKVVYSGDATDTEPIRRHVRRESENATIKARLKDPDDGLELVIVKDMMLTGYDSPPLHTLYLDRPLKGALLMQTLARVNRTFRGKDAGLLVGYAPLAENLQRALDEYTEADRAERPVGRDLSEVIDLVQRLLGLIREAVAGFDLRSRLVPSDRKSWFEAAMSMTNYLRSATTAGNLVPEGEERLVDRYRRLSGRLTRAWALSSGTDALAPLRYEVLFYEEVRIYMAKFDAEERRASGQPVPEEIQRLLAAVIADSTETGDVVDIYEAAGIPKPELSELNSKFAARAQQATNPQLAIEALRKAILEEIGRVTRSNLVRERVFSERVTALMNRYTNSQLTSAEVIAELVALAKEVSAESRRGAKFHPPLDHDQLAFYDAVAANESAVLEQGEDVLAQIARELVAIMRRDVRTDWTVREDVRAKLRSSIKRLLVKYDYPPDKQPGAIKLVMEQMEQLAPHYVDSRY